MMYEDTLDHITDTVGRPVDEVEVEIRDMVTGERCPAGVQGEICVRSDTSLVCYYKLDIEKQAVDAVSGVTVSSNAVQEAVAELLAQASGEAPAGEASGR